MISSTVKLILGDCLEIMKGMPDKSVDLVLTSPPYNMGKGKRLGYHPLSTVGQNFYGEYLDNKTNTEYCNWCIKVIQECLRVSRYVFWNVQLNRSTREAIFLVQEKFNNNLKDIFIWQKQAVANIRGKNGNLAKGWEYVFMFGQDKKPSFEYHNFPDNGYVPNIKQWYKKEFFKEHHATFTKEMALYFCEYFTKENDTVLDPFTGTGTTGVSCKELNRNFIGIEISPEYFKIAEQRIYNTQGSLL
jgi:site-specific DNA-methyltransferase (adenine-specific)